MKKLFIAPALTTCLLLAGGTANANLIDDAHGVGAGSFELGNFVDNSLGYMTLTPGSTTMTGWTVGGPGNGIDWTLATSYGASSGNYAVDLAHQTASSVSTMISTVIGNAYDVSFFAGSAAGFNSTGTVSAGSLVNQSFTVETVEAFPHTLSLFSFSFTATNALTTLTFASAGSNHYGPAIDDVSVMANSVPGPGTALLLGIGFAGMIGFGLKKNEQAMRLKRAPVAS